MRRLEWCTFQKNLDELELVVDEREIDGQVLVLELVIDSNVEHHGSELQMLR